MSLFTEDMQASVVHLNILDEKSSSISLGLDKNGYLVNNFLISRRKHMLWVLIRSASPRRF